MTIDEIMSAAPVIPVLVLDGSLDPAALAETLVGAGLPVIATAMSLPDGEAVTDGAAGVCRTAIA